MDETLRGWLAIKGDWLVGTLLISFLTSSIVGWRKRSKGVALLMSHISSGLLAIVMFILGTIWGYDPLNIIVVAGPISGACSFAAFSLLMKINDRIEARGDELADRIIDKAVPGKEATHDEH